MHELRLGHTLKIGSDHREDSKVLQDDGGGDTLANFLYNGVRQGHEDGADQSNDARNGVVLMLTLGNE